MMKNLSLVSVILPTYNRATLLSRAINSVLAQTYSHWELIIWDDGSTDITGKLVASYHDERIRYYAEKNHGVAYARNRAIEVSFGDYLAFLDSDDEWVNDKLAAQVEALNAYPQIDVLFSDFIDNIEATQEKYRTFEQYANVLKLLKVEKIDHNLFVIKNGILESLPVENFIATDSVIIRRELLEKTGAFIEELRNSEDLELWWRLGLTGACFAYISKVYVTRYKPLGSLSSSSIEACKNHIKGLDLCLEKSLLGGRNDLIPYLNIPYGNTWANMIPMYAAIGDRKGMFNAFFQSIKYKFTFGSIRLLVEAVLDRKILGE